MSDTRTIGLFDKRFRGAIWFSVAVAAVIGGWFAFNWAYAKVFIAPLKFEPLIPGRINLLGVELASERIVVSNGIAMLRQTIGGDAGPEGVSGAGGTVIPLDALIGSLRHEEESVGNLVGALNDLDTVNFPPQRVTWTHEDILSALSGDERLSAKLEAQLGTTLDGLPAETINLGDIRTGIFIRASVPVHVPGAEGGRVVEGIVTLEFRSRFAEEILRHRLVRERIDLDEGAIIEIVRDTWELLRESPPQDVRKSLQDRLSVASMSRYARPAEDLLSRVSILATDGEMLSASLSSKPNPAGQGQLHTVHLEISDDARKRLWQYTYLHPRVQLLFSVDDIAIAAPIVQHEMKYSTVEITNVDDDVDAEKAIAIIEGSSGQ